MDESLRLRARNARVEIEAGALRGAALADVLLSIPYADRDAWLDEVLGVDALPADMEGLPQGSVPYLPSGVDEIMTMVREVPVAAGDVLVDVGSGLGRVLVLAHLLSGARGRGIELQGPLVESARALCAALGIGVTDVAFVHADADDADLSALGGTVFFFYAPFDGRLLARVLRRLEDVARRRPIVLCAVALELRDVPWLVPRASSSTVSLTIYDSYFGK